jgi:uncharacterized protein (DUF885 family)
MPNSTSPQQPFPLRPNLLPQCPHRRLVFAPFRPAACALVVLSLLLSTAHFANAAPTQGSVEDRRKALNALFSEMWEDGLKHNPEFASTLGDKRYNDQLSDYSVEAYNEELSRGRKYLLSLSQIDPTGLSDQEQLSRDLLIRQLVQEQEEAEFKPWEMPITQMGGLQTELPALVPSLTFEGVKDYDDYIARLKKIPTALQQVTDNLDLGIEDQRLPPKYILEKALAQVNNIAGQKPEDSPFALPVKKFPASVSAAEQERIRTEVLAAITKQVLPAYSRLARYLQSQYIPHGRTDPGIWAIPGGDRYYAFLVRQSTTTSLTPDQIHQVGLAEVQRNETEMLAIAQKLGFKDLKSFQTTLSTNPKLHAQSTDQLMATYRGYIDQMKPKLPQLFGRLPKAPLVLEQVPTYMEKDQTQAYYYPGSPDGKRPGKVYVNFYNVKERSLANVEAVSYHEGIPGHHLQISISQELEGVPEFRKQMYFTAYTEGWALYSERLGKEVGFYQDPYSDYGRLEADNWRAIRLVVDTGVHAKHWTRDQVLEFFRAHSTMDDTNIQAETDRYIAWPAQALGYKIGQLKLIELRERARQAFGPKFDLRAFHDQVLDSGALPLDVLETRINAWIATAKAKP